MCIPCPQLTGLDVMPPPLDGGGILIRGQVLVSEEERGMGFLTTSGPPWLSPYQTRPADVEAGFPWGPSPVSPGWWRGLVGQVFYYVICF